MGDWNFQWAPVCLPEELADPFYEPDGPSEPSEGRKLTERAEDADET